MVQQQVLEEKLETVWEEELALVLLQEQPFI